MNLRCDNCGTHNVIVEEDGSLLCLKCGEFHRVERPISNAWLIVIALLGIPIGVIVWLVIALLVL